MKIKITLTKIFRYLYVLLIVANLIIGFFVYKFVNKYLYKTIVLDKHLIENSITKTDDISTEEVDKMISQYKLKTSQNPRKKLNNPFD